MQLLIEYASSASFLGAWWVSNSVYRHSGPIILLPALREPISLCSF